MPYDVGIVIPVVRNEHYEYFTKLAETRALPSTYQSEQWCSIGVTLSEGDTLKEARNRGAEQIGSRWLIFLDADDELDFFYVERMLRGLGDIRQPATVGYTDGVYRDGSGPNMIPVVPLWERNSFVISSMMKRELFLDVGGFDDDEVFEDWCLFCRMYAAGATFGGCPKAIYRVHTDSKRLGRNEATPDSVKARVTMHVRNDVLPMVRERGWV